MIIETLCEESAPATPGTEKELKTVQWKDFIYKGTVYELGHLAPFTLQWERPAKDKRPATVFTVDVTFSFHCFTSDPDELYDSKLRYSDARETRMFDFERYELSKRLPEIVRSMSTRQCLHAGRGNFVTIDIVAEDGQTKRYHVFFEPSKSSIKGRVNLYIQSGYVPTRPVKHTKMPMNFLYILHNTLNGTPFKS